jgi:hypothetical protein
MGIDPFTAQIGASVIGGIMGKKGADTQSAANQAAIDAQLAPFRQYQPYVDANLSGSSGALDSVLETGAYTGPTYAGPNQFQTGTATNMGNIGGNLQNSGYGMMNNTSGFGSNANSLFNQYQGMANSAQGDRLATAMDYARANANPLVDAAMRDDRRNLQENTLTGIDLAASGTGNTNSSRAGVAEAVAQRAFNDRQADVALDVQDRLIDRSLNQQARQFDDQGAALQGAGMANEGIQNAYTQGLNTLGQGSNFGMNAGNSLQGYDQARMDDARANFERQRDFELNQRKAYQSGILGGAPTSVGAVQANSVDPFQAAMGGAMSGFGFGQQYFPQQPTTTFNPFSTATQQQMFNSSIAPPSFSF